MAKKQKVQPGTIVELRGSDSLIGGYEGSWQVVAVQGSWLELEPTDPKVLAAEISSGLRRSYGYGRGRNEVDIVR